MSEEQKITLTQAEQKICTRMKGRTTKQIKDVHLLAAEIAKRGKLGAKSAKDYDGAVIKAATDAGLPQNYASFCKSLVIEQVFEVEVPEDTPDGQTYTDTAKRSKAINKAAGLSRGTGGGRKGSDWTDRIAKEESADVLLKARKLIDARLAELTSDES